MQYDEHYFMRIFSVLPGSIYWKNKEGIYLGANDYAIKMVGLESVDELIGKTDFDIFSKKEAEVYRKNDLKVINSGKTITVEESVRTPEGKEITQLSIKTPLLDEDGSTIGIVGYTLDITARKKAEEESKKAKEQLDKNNQAKAKFLRILQHDLRNKLTGILSFSDLLLDVLDDKKQLRTGLTIINQAGKSIIPTLDRINHYLSLETGQLKPYYRGFELHPFLEGFKEKHQHVLAEKNLSMEFLLDPKLEGRFVGDELLIYDVLDHLITNAIKYTDQGAITIETHLLRKQRDYVWLDILVRDTGRGMSKRVAKNLFQLFEYEPSDEPKKYVTPGINLSISRKIAELMGGDLFVDSQEGQGTDFFFHLKLKSEEAPKRRYPVQSPEKVAELALERESLKTIFKKEKFLVLVVEDDLINLEALQALLSTYFKCDILSAMDLKTAVKLVNEHHDIDLILTDIHLPDGEGHQIMPYLYKIHPSNEDLPAVVAVTAFAREVDIDYFCDQGILNVISKPITLEKLTEVIYSLFGNKVIKKVHKA